MEGSACELVEVGPTDARVPPNNRMQPTPAKRHHICMRKFAATLLGS